MSQRYARINPNDDDDDSRTDSPGRSPPPSFRSRASSITPHHTNSERDRLVSDADRTLADTFDSPSDDDSDDEHTPRLDERQRVMSGRPVDRRGSGDDTPLSPDGRPAERRVTQLPVFAPPTSNRTYGGGNGGHDGVFANLSAKPARAGETEDLDEKPPTYEQAAADATPPYWETTILTPGSSGSPDDVFIDGLPVGSFFSFVWNGMISMSFQLVGFLLTYLLHTTHAAEHGSKAGLGITMIQFGFGMKRSASSGGGGPDTDHDTGGAGGSNVSSDGDGFVPPPPDPNSHDFDPTTAAAGAAFVADASSSSGAGAVASGMKASDWFAYALMIVGWFILIRAISEYFKARRHEQLVLQSPSRGLNVPVVAEGEGSERAV